MTLPAAPLQRGSPACFAWLSGPGTGGVCASLRRVAGCATPASSAGHASAGAETVPKLTLPPDHPKGADHKALAQMIRKPGLDIFQTFNEVGLEVKRSTGGAQQPWLSSSPIEGVFYFKPGS